MLANECSKWLDTRPICSRWQVGRGGNVGGHGHVGPDGGCNVAGQGQ